MWQYVSLRHEEGLLKACFRIDVLEQRLLGTHHAIQDEAANMSKAAGPVIATLQRRESRGSHWRSDYDLLDTSLYNAH